MAELIEVANILFKDRSKWISVSDEDKSKFFFIFNRFFSKRYPEHSLMLNSKVMDKVAGMDLWFYFMEGKPYPRWFWSKSPKSKETISKSDISMLRSRLDIDKEEDVEFLLEHYPDLIEEELENYKKILKQK